MAVRIVLVDDHRILRDGLRMILKRESDLSIVGEAGDARAAMACVRETAPDLVLMDLQLPDDDGLACTQRILVDHPGTKVVVLSGSPDLSRVQEALRIGAEGYVLKDEAADELVRAVRTVMQGKVHLSPSAATALVAGLRPAPVQNTAPPAPSLSERELAVLKAVVEGLRNKEIADQLGVGLKSVETYRARLMAKLGCSSTAELVRYAIREGLARP